jgi:hypothetical protein
MKAPYVKLVSNNGNNVPAQATASDDGKMEYFALFMIDSKPVGVYGPFPSQRSAEDAIAEWYLPGEWYVVTKVKVVHKMESSNAKH